MSRRRMDEADVAWLAIKMLLIFVATVAGVALIIATLPVSVPLILYGRHYKKTHPETEG